MGTLYTGPLQATWMEPGRRRLAWRGQCAKVGRESEERPGNGLRGAVPGKKLLRCHPSGHDLSLQQREHHMAAAEHQRAGTIERIGDIHHACTGHGSGDGKSDEEHAEHDQRDHPSAP